MWDTICEKLGDLCDDYGAFMAIAAFFLAFTLAFGIIFGTFCFEGWLLSLAYGFIASAFGLPSLSFWFFVVLSAILTFFFKSRVKISKSNS